MKISRKCEYALTVMLDLSNHHQNELVHISDLATRRNIPKKFLEQILLGLKRGGLVQSKKGPKGGYCLNRSPEKIMLGEVIRLMDSALFSISDNSTESNGNGCELTREGFFGVIREIDKSICNVIDRISFAEVQKREEKVLTDENSGDFYFI